MIYYILDEAHNIIPIRDVITWAKFFESNDRIVKQEIINNYKISTVFLGIDHGIFSNKPAIFETMVFAPDGSSWPEDGEYQERCATWQEAEQMHEEAKKYLLQKLKEVN